MIRSAILHLHVISSYLHECTNHAWPIYFNIYLSKSHLAAILILSLLIIPSSPSCSLCEEPSASSSSSSSCWMYQHMENTCFETNCDRFHAGAACRHCDRKKTRNRMPNQGKTCSFKDKVIWVKWPTDTDDDNLWDNPIITLTSPHIVHSIYFAGSCACGLICLPFLVGWLVNPSQTLSGSTKFNRLNSTRLS